MVFGFKPSNMGFKHINKSLYHSRTSVLKHQMWILNSDDQTNGIETRLVLKYQMWILNVRSPHSKQFQGEF